MKKNNLDIIDLLGLKDTTIELQLTQDIKEVVDNGIDDYIEKQRKNHQLKEDFVNTFNNGYVYSKIKNKLIQDGFVYKCRYCWGLDVSGQYGKPIEKYKQKNH